MTGTTWFNIMTEQEQNEFIHAYNVQRPMRGPLRYYLSTHFNNFRGFMSRSFVWDESPQGSEYWVDVLEKYLNSQPTDGFYFKKVIKEFTL